ncbi:MAG: hypothetical protein HY895_09875 [Deltaproteobacteria bacterium]|nr:hypothetical protein [Deltaproteobacteria bacterium]
MTPTVQMSRTHSPYRQVIPITEDFFFTTQLSEIALNYKPSQEQQITAEGKARADEEPIRAAGGEHISGACNATSALSDAFFKMVSTKCSEYAKVHSYSGR